MPWFLDMNVAFLANTYHLTKTRSSQFFIDLLNQWFGPVTVVPHQDVWTRMPGPWDLVIVWQHWFRRPELEAFGARSVVLVPMYDECPREREFWSAYEGFRVLCFSRSLADLLEPWGFECLRVSYRPSVPPEQAGFDGGLRGFFWPRTTALDWRQVGPLTGGTRFRSFHLHTADTPSQAALPTRDEVLADEWVQTGWFDRSQDYGHALARANVFFAPRRQEGIGMAVLEALALGQCVVAPNQPTANEYVTSGVDGLLYDADAPVSLDFSHAEQLGMRARKAAVEGRAAWEGQLESIRGFLETRPSRPVRRFHPVIVVRGKILAWLRGGYRTWKRWRRSETK
jgi:hypothetical protein